MKKHYILTAAIALTLCACGGGNNNQNNAAQTADTSNVASEPNSDDKTQLVMEIMKNNFGIRYEIKPDRIMSSTDEFAKTLGVNSEYFRCFEDFDNHYETVYSFFFYPVNGGGNDIIIERKEVGLDDEMYNLADNRDYFCKKYNAESTTDIKDVIPLTINDFYSNADKFPEPSRLILEETIKRNLKIKFLDNNKIEVTLNPYETEYVCEDEYKLILPYALSGFYDKKDNVFPSATMTWDNGKFVRQSKPIEEDLKYFSEVKIPTGVIVDIWKLMTDFNPTQYFDQNRLVGLYVDNNLAIEAFAGDEWSQITESYACYPLKSGGYLVLKNVEQTDNYGVDVFKYENGKLEEYKQNPFESDLFEKKTDKQYDRDHDYFPGFFSHFFDDGFVLQSEKQYIYFKWNGEKFVVIASTSNHYSDVDKINEKREQIIKELYTKYVFGDEEPDEENLKKYCTDKMIKYLRDHYDYEGEGIAIWCFRGNCQTEILQAKITDIRILGGGFLRINYVNGSQGKDEFFCDVCAVVENDKVLIDSIIK